MNLKHPGKSTSKAEVTHIFKHGIWVLLDDQEFMLSFSEFPWFKNATVAQIHNVVRKHGSHLHWPALDVDLDAERMASPEHFPLVAK